MSLDDKGSGRIVKRDDHLMDDTRYLIINGRVADIPGHCPLQVSGLSFRSGPNLKNGPRSFGICWLRGVVPNTLGREGWFFS